MTGHADTVREALHLLDHRNNGGRKDMRNHAALDALVAALEQAEQQHVARMAPLVECAADLEARAVAAERERDAALAEKERWKAICQFRRQRQKAAERRAADAENALERYGEHDRSCNYIGQPVFGACTCGYLAVLAGSQTTQEPA